MCGRAYNNPLFSFPVFYCHVFNRNVSVHHGHYTLCLFAELNSVKIGLFAIKQDLRCRGVLVHTNLATRPSTLPSASFRRPLKKKVSRRQRDSCPNGALFIIACCSSYFWPLGAITTLAEAKRVFIHIHTSIMTL